MSAPVATIIVVAFNSAPFLPRLMASIEAQTETRWQLIVIDNASTIADRPQAKDLTPGATLIQNDVNIGFAAANNLAARSALAPYLVFLNPDAFPKPDWLARLLETAERFPRVAAIGSTQLRADKESEIDGIGDVLHATGLAYRAGYGQRASIPPLAESFAACGAAMLVRREAFNGVSGFDERYFCYFEDVDLCFRLRLLGAPIVQSPAAVVAHVGGGSNAQKSAFAEFHGARNRLWTFVKCMPSALMWALLPAHAIATGLVATLGPIRGRGWHAWRGIIAGWRGIGPILETRKAIQRERQASLSDIAAALAWSPDVLFTRRAVHRKIRG